MSAKILSSPIEVGINVNNYPSIRSELRSDSVLRFTSLDNIHRFSTTVEDLKEYLFEGKGIGEYVSQCGFIEDTLFSPRENSTPAVRVRLAGYTEAEVKSVSCEHTLNSRYIAAVKKKKKVNEANQKLLPEYYIPIADGVLRVQGTNRYDLVPITFLSDHVVIRFDDKGLTREIYRPPGGSLFRLKTEGELIREASIGSLTAEWYTGNYLKSISQDEQTWKVTRGEIFSLPDRVAGEEIERRVGRLFIAKNVKTKVKRIVPTRAGVASILYRTVVSIKEGGGEYPEPLLKDIKNFQHVEVRRILMSIVGTEKFLLKAKTLDIDIDSGIHRALVLDEEDGQKYLVCHDGSTEKQYVLSVPDRTIDREEITTCAEASATLSSLSVDATLPWNLRTTVLDIANSDKFKAES